LKSYLQNQPLSLVLINNNYDQPRNQEVHVEITLNYES
jgi:hypothetical protein